MKSLTLIIISSLLLTGCVSQKKYQEKVTELQKLKASYAVNQAVEEAPTKKAEVENPQQVAEMKREMQQMGMEMERMRKQLDAADAPQLSPEQMQMMEVELTQKFELESRELEEELMKDESKSIARNISGSAAQIEIAAEAALRPYDESDILITRTNSSTTISLARKAHFENDGSLNDSGKLVAEKLDLLFEKKGELKIRLLEIGNESAAANALHSHFKNNAAYRMGYPIVGSASCKYATVRMKNCDRIDLVFYAPTDQLINLLSR